MTPKILVRGIVVSLIVATLQACEADSELTQYSDSEMRAKIQECKTAKSPAPAMIFACENYARECKKRADKAGHFVC